MGHKDKMQLLYKGARVRVANELYGGAERWAAAHVGKIVEEPNATGAMVHVDGETAPRLIVWSNLDVIEKPRDHLMDVPLSEIRPSRWQYRRSFDPDKLLELAQSIGEYGLINALLVFKHEKGGYELIAGERRLRALAAIAFEGHRGHRTLKQAATASSGSGFWDDQGIREVLAESPATARVELRPGLAEDYHAIAVIENLQRENPSPIEEAAAFQALMVANMWTQAALAQHLGKSPGYVSQRLSLLDLAEDAQQAVHSGEIPFVSARAIATLPKTVQPAVTEQVKRTMAGDDGATTRQVQARVGQIKRFLDPKRWRPPEHGEDAILTPDTRNRYRLLEYHVRYLVEYGAERAGEAVARLQNMGSLGSNWTGKRPATIAEQNYMTTKVLNALTCGEEDPYQGIEAYWQALAGLKDYVCEVCAFSSVTAPEGGVDAGAACPRWSGHKVRSCLNWIGPGDPVCLRLDYSWNEAIEVYGEAELDLIEHDHRTYLGDILQYRDLVVLAADLHAQAQKDRRERFGYLDEMRSYWEQQPPGTGTKFDLSHAQAHACRLCRFYRPDLDPDAGWPPCHFAAEPLTHEWRGAPRAPTYGVLVREDAVMVPRCERFQVAHGDDPALAPVKGITFPKDKAGRALVLDWLRDLAKSSPGSNREGTMPGVLAWLPYERPDDEVTDLDSLLRYVIGAWNELGDGVVARLLSVAMSERRARDGYQGAFNLMNPITGMWERWAAVDWQTWSNGRDPGYIYPKGWWRPWIPGEEQEAGDE